MTRKPGKVKTVKRLARATRIPAGRVIEPGKDKRKRSGRSAEREAIREQMEDVPDRARREP